ncbi:MAG TPA: hypothetical protein VNT55_19065 [Baekduia sp.]|nr:hypothetical protein [Baekduia sp.]
MFRQLVGCSSHGAQRLARTRARLAPLVDAVMERERRAGAIRADAEPQDVPLIMLMLNMLAEAGRDVAPEVWLLDGSRADPVAAGALPPAVSLEDLDLVVEAAHSA